MPAASEPLSLPRTWRPLGVTLAVVGGGLMFLLVGGFAWFGMDPDNQARFSMLQKLTIVALLLGAGWGAWVLGRCKVVASETGVLVVNGLRTASYEWTEVTGVLMSPGMPWARLSLADGSVRQLIALQASDGPRAERGVNELRALIAERAGS